MIESASVLLRTEEAHKPPQEVLIADHFAGEVQLLQTYANTVTNTGRSLNHPMRTCAYLSDFSHGRLNDEVFAATLLHDVAQTAWPQAVRGSRSSADLHTKNAARLLQDYSSSGYAKEQLDASGLTRWGYISGLLSDLNIVEEYAERNRSDEMGKSPELLRILSNHSIGEVTREQWLEPGALTRPAVMAELLGTGEHDQGANLEAVLIKAAEKLDDLFYPPDNERSVLRDVHDAESFYAPICEIIGQDGLASALRSQAAIIRLEKSGHGAFVDKARDIIGSLGNREEVLLSVEGILSKLAVGSVLVDHAFRDTTGHGITLGTAELEVHDDAEPYSSAREARAIWRIKSVGSLAMKLLGDHKDLMGKAAEEQQQGLVDALLPADVLGITIVVPDENELASLYARAAVDIYDDQEVPLIRTPSREESYHISGSTEFKLKVVGALALEGTNRDDQGNQKLTVNEIDIPERETAYSVAKLMVGYNALRTEVQFVTEETRIDARTGLAAHWLYKLMKQLELDDLVRDENSAAELSPLEAGAMRDIHDRGLFLDGHVLVDPKHPRAVAFRKRIARVSAGWQHWYRQR